MTEGDMLRELTRALQRCGVPELAILTEFNLKLSDGQILRPDLIVVAADGETPLAAFEMKKTTPESVYNIAKNELLPFVAKGLKAFVVTMNNDGIYFSQIGKWRWLYPKWRPLADLREAFGFYLRESLRIQEQNNLNEARLARFRHWVVFVGISTLVDVAIIEVLGFEFSWKVYSLIGVVFLLYTISYGFNIKLDFNGKVISISHKEEGGK